MTTNLFTTLAIAATIVPLAVGGMAPEAKAEVGGAALQEAVRRTGTTWDTGWCDESGVDGYFSYYVGTMEKTHIQICTNHNPSAAKQWETFRHEAIHLAQKCENRLHGETFETLTTWSFLKTQATESDAQFVTRAYPREKWGIELEAFTFMKQSNQTIANVVNRACN